MIEDSHPLRSEENLEASVDTAFWFWTKFKRENINTQIDKYYAELANSAMNEQELHDEVVRRVTRIVNGGDRGLAERQSLFRKIREKLK